MLLPTYGNITDLEDDNGTDDENVTFEDLESETEEEIIESDSETEEVIIESDRETEDVDHDEESDDNNEVQDVPTSSKANQITKVVKKTDFSRTQNKWVQLDESVIEEKT